MTRQERVRFAEILRQLKEQQSTLFTLMDQLASVRDVLKDASPEFAFRFSERVAHWQSLNASLRAETDAAFDEKIATLFRE
jgi:hypothetical protein